MTFPKKLRLRAWSPTLEGDGLFLELQLEAFRKGKKGAGHSWRGRLVLDLDRQFVRNIATQIVEMQKRDRERLARERDRLEFEVLPITGNKPTEAI